MPKLNAVLETALYVDDLPRARAFYEGSLGLPVLFANGRMCAFDVGGAERASHLPARGILRGHAYARRNDPGP